MPKFRKKPVVIEAFQMTRNRGRNTTDWPDWLHAAYEKENGEPGRVFRRAGREGWLAIITLEGHHEVMWGDYIIQGVKGELYPCKPDIFELTYEAVE